MRIARAVAVVYKIGILATAAAETTTVAGGVGVNTLLMKWTTPFLIITFAPTMYASFTVKLPSEFAVTLTETPALELKDEAALRPVVVARVSKRM